MADETRDPTTVTPARARANAAAAAQGEGRNKTELIRVGDRGGGDGSRTSPRMRFDVLQIAAWVVGLVLIVAGLVALARTGFEDLGLFEPVVQIGTEAATPLYAAIWLLLGLVIVAAGTGVVAERRLRILGALFAIVGLVLLIEPDGFSEYLGAGSDSGTVPLAFGVLLVAASFVPPLSIKRPGIRED
ncbi:MAG: hypothetical protein WEB03_16735 [Nitriliruptor sp.]|uniref:hypothetical protein n=1 Tax=Nitriliruptor sp. TaxID=2448056 RepID=UPI0034A01350